MRVIIEGREEVFDLKGKKITLKSVVSEVGNFLQNAGKFPVAMSLDGVALSEEELIRRGNEFLEAETMLEFEVMDVLKFLSKRIEETQPVHGTFCKMVEEAVASYKSHKALPHRAKVAAHLYDFMQFWHQVTKLIPHLLEQHFYQQETLAECVQQLLDNAKAIIVQLEKTNDPEAISLLEQAFLPGLYTLDAAMPYLQTALIGVDKAVGAAPSVQNRK